MSPVCARRHNWRTGGPDGRNIPLPPGETPLPLGVGSVTQSGCVRVAQPDRAQDSWFSIGRHDGKPRGGSAQIRGTLWQYVAVPIPSQGRSDDRQGVETGWAAPAGRLRPMVKGQSRPRTPCLHGGGESRSGMNPGAVGSNPAADTNIYSKQVESVLGMTVSCHFHDVADPGLFHRILQPGAWGTGEETDSARGNICRVTVKSCRGVQKARKHCNSPDAVIE